MRNVIAQENEQRDHFTDETVAPKLA